jgi:hypothetical protein
MSIIYTIDDEAFQYSSEPTTPVVVPPPIEVFNTRQCISGIGGTRCTAAGNMRALTDPADAATVIATLNAKVAQGLIAEDNSLANTPQAGSTNSQVYTMPITFTTQKVISGVIGKITNIVLVLFNWSYVFNGAGAGPNILSLQAPQGQTVEPIGFPYPGFAQSFSGQTIVFDDQNGVPWTGNNPNGGIFNTVGLPGQTYSLTQLRGLSPNGTWLFDLERAGGSTDTSVVNGWDIIITVSP